MGDNRQDLGTDNRKDLGTLLLTDKRSRLRAIFDLELRRAAHAQATCSVSCEAKNQMIFWPLRELKGGNGSRHLRLAAAARCAQAENFTFSWGELTFAVGPNLAPVRWWLHLSSSETSSTWGCAALRMLRQLALISCKARNQMIFWPLRELTRSKGSRRLRLGAATRSGNSQKRMY